MNVISISYDNFDLDYRRPKVVKWVQKPMAMVYRQHKCHMHKYYTKWVIKEELLLRPHSDTLAEWGRKCAIYSIVRSSTCIATIKFLLYFHQDRDLFCTLV